MGDAEACACLKSLYELPSCPAQERAHEAGAAHAAARLLLRAAADPEAVAYNRAVNAANFLMTMAYDLETPSLDDIAACGGLLGLVRLLRSELSSKPGVTHAAMQALLPL